MAILPRGAQAHHSSPLSVPWLMCAFLAGVVVFQHVNSSSVGVISGSVSKAPLDATKVHQLTGVYSCMGNGRLRAVREVLRRWRLFYPDAPVYIINDGGDKALEGIAAEFGANYTYAARASSADTQIFSTAVAAIAWVQRMVDAGKMSDNVMLVEDDVHIWKPIALHTLQHDINGENRDVQLPDGMVKVIERVRGFPVTDRHYGGFGGAIMRGSFLRLLARSDWKPWVEEMLAANQNTLHSDQVLTSLMHCVGGTLGHYPGFVETWYKDYEQRKAAGDIEVVHKEKSFYD